MDGTTGRAANVTAEALILRRPELVEAARPHVTALRGLTVDEAQLYGIERGLSQQVLMVAEAMAVEFERLVAS